MTGLEKFKKPPTDEEKEFIQKERDRLCNEVYLIRKDKDVKKLISSHKQTASKEEKTLNKYEKVYLELNRDVRTDTDNIIHL